ncbi:MAG: 30S ribosomal protein S18 [Patescibacteria group bacterium]|nr:30S ribosomal protein S18 [Patescibacteria group bacterium]
MAETIFRKPCMLCAEKIETINYRDINFLKRFLTPYSKIASTRRSGNCARHQRMVAKAIKRARVLGLLTFVR